MMQAARSGRCRLERSSSCVAPSGISSSGSQPLAPAPTPETTSVRLESRYALSKFDQERMCLVLGRAHGIPTVVLRLFNVYGARQSRSNPYTGDLSRFVSRLLAGQRPLVLEDGEQRRDFVNVHDVARACCLALESQVAPGAVLNIGSGESTDDLARRAEDGAAPRKAASRARAHR